MDPEHSSQIAPALENEPHGFDREMFGSLETSEDCF